MGTKNNPGDFDCYANADPDEPMFILLGRDPFAPQLVEAWAALRREAGDDPTKIQEALDCAEAMRRDLRERGRMEAPNCIATATYVLNPDALYVLKGRP